MALFSDKNIIQTRVCQTNVVTAWSSGNMNWSEARSEWRVNITPHSTSSLILLRYFIPINQYSGGANNIFGFRAYRFSPSATEALSGYGQSSGSRMRTAGWNARAQNGFDWNDMNMESFTTYDLPNTTSQCTYGFQVYRENSDAGSIYIGYTQGNNSTWGMTGRVVIVAEEHEV